MQSPLSSDMLMHLSLIWIIAKTCLRELAVLGTTLERERERERPFSSPEGYTQFSLPSYAAILSKSGGEQSRKCYHQIFQQRAEIFVPGHLSAFVCVLNPQSPSGLSSYGDTDHGREPLPPWYICICKCHPGGHTCI